MSEEPILDRTARVRDVRVPDDPGKSLEKLLQEVLQKLSEIRNPEDGNLRFFRVVFELLAKLGIHGTVFQTGILDYKDKNEKECSKTFIFSGSYELQKKDEVYFMELPSGKFEAVVVGEINRIPTIPDNEKL